MIDKQTVLSAITDIDFFGWQSSIRLSSNLKLETNRTYIELTDQRLPNVDIRFVLIDDLAVWDIRISNADESDALLIGQLAVVANWICDEL